MILYNTLTRKKEKFKPIKPGNAGFYSCGPTVYNYAHIGNLRTYIFSDVLKRSLKYLGYKVKHVMNITDVGHLTDDADEGEDKIEKGAKREGKSVWEIARFYEKAFFEDAKALNILKPNKVARATDYISVQIKLIKKIQDAGFAYETMNGLYFDVSKFKNYGKLSGQSLEEKLKCVRSEITEDKEKKNQFDFALWVKRVGKHKNHVMHWKSPWGDGFPGWHIECSAISSKLLGQPFDIHTGGEDHIGTHHENEIAQSKAATGKNLANIWIHSRHMVFDSEKMSKSSGYFITLSDVKDKGFTPICFRYLCLMAHYRSPLNFSWESLASASSGYENLIDSVAGFIGNQKKSEAKTDIYIKQFKREIEDDLDIPRALAVLWKLIKDKKVVSREKVKLIKEFDKVFGLDIIPRAERKLKKQKKIPKEIMDIAKKREEYRKNKDFKKADKIRLILAKKGYKIKDSEKGFIIIHN